MEDSEPQDSDNIIQDTSAPEDNGSNDSGPEETEVKSVLNPEGASDTAETLFMARNLRRMDGENQVYVRRRLAQKLERQQEDLKKKQESENKTKPQNAGNAHGSNCKLLIMTCFLLPSLLLAIVCLLSSLIRNEKELNYYMLGLSNFEMGQYESALWWFLKDLEVQEAVEDEAAHINARVGVADAYRLLGKTDQATFQFNTALQLAQLTGDLHGQMQVYFSMGDMEREQFHSPRTSIQYYEQALALAKHLEDSGEKGWAYNKMEWVYLTLETFKAALRGKKHLRVSRKSKDKKGQITAHTKVGDAFRELGKLDQAIYNFDTALQLAQQTGDLHGQMQVYFFMADMQREQLHSPRTAIQYYEQALALAGKLGDIRKERMAYIKLGLANYENKEYETALEWDQKFLMISQNNGNKIKEITAHKNAVDSYKALGRPDQARSHFQSALTIAMETGNKQEQMNIYLSLGDLHREQLHEPRESHKYYTDMLALAKDLGNKDDERLAYNRLGLACKDMQKKEAALEWHQKDLTMSQENKNKSAQITAHQNIAASYQALGKPDQARSHYQSAINIAIEIGNKQEQMDIYLGLGDLHRVQLHEPQESHKYYTEMLTLAKDLKRKNKERQAYNRLGLACEDMQDNEAALEWHQKNLMLSKEHENKNEPLIAHKNTARSYQALSKPDQARSHFQSALDIAMETGNKQEQMDIYVGLVYLHRVQLHEPQKSQKYYTDMLALAKEIESKEDERLAYVILGVACEVMQDSEAALGWYQKYLEMSQTGEDKTEQIKVHKRIAASYQALGKLDQTISHYRSAMTIAMETGDKQEQMNIYLSLGDLHREQLHEPQESHKYYTEMLALAKDLGRKNKEGLAYNRLGVACEDMQDNEAALEWHQKNLKIRQEDEDKAAQITAHTNIARSYKALGKPDLARPHFQSVLDIAMETGNKQKQEDIT